MLLVSLRIKGRITKTPDTFELVSLHDCDIRLSLSSQHATYRITGRQPSLSEMNKSQITCSIRVVHLPWFTFIGEDTHHCSDVLPVSNGYYHPLSLQSAQLFPPPPSVVSSTHHLSDYSSHLIHIPPQNVDTYLQTSKTSLSAPKLTYIGNQNKNGAKTKRSRKRSIAFEQVLTRQNVWDQKKVEDKEKKNDCQASRDEKKDNVGKGRSIGLERLMKKLQLVSPLT